jgi:Ca2+-binding RTX toxin-like protein
MAVIPVTTNLFEFDPSQPALILAAGNTLNLSANAAIFAMGTGVGANGITAEGANVMNLAGLVHSRDQRAISSVAGNHEISIAATGSLVSYITAISLDDGGNTIMNAGRISSGVGSGIFIGGAGSNVVVNSGTINAAEKCVSILGTGNTLHNSGTLEGRNSFVAVSIGGSVTNSGTIRGGVGIQFENFGANSLNNSGTIAAFSGIAVGGSAQVETILNTGLITTMNPVAIVLSGGDDTYDGRLGRVVGEVRGGIGNDTLLGGLFVDVFRGEGNNDTFNGGGGADFLDGGDGNDRFELGADGSDVIGDASGVDTVTSTITRTLTWAFIENLILEGAAPINGTGNALGNSIVGNGGNNILAGLGGNDILVGGGGNDQLFGQADKDSLTGGAGGDRFVYQTVGQTAVGLGDVIVDLNDNGDDVIDLTGIPGVLTFIGQQAFTAAGQVRYQQVGANVLVQINTDGNSVAEGEITLLNTTIGNAAVGQVSSSDFLL